ncbi:MAG: hypothetical protein LC742_02175 [Acidobacteria bacterium]|nr:hypothetical protein [Acidobacteriota bacterium]
MNDLPRHTLSRIIAEHGRGICDAPKRIEALLRDLCGAYRREINIIIGALEERVAVDLIAAGNSVPRDVLLARLAARLRDNLAYTPEAARWGVETWAVALGILSKAEFQARARTESADASQSAAPPPMRDPKPSVPNPASVSPQASQPQRGTAFAPPQPPPQSPKTIPPPIIRPPAPAPRRTPMMPPNVTVPEPPQQNVSPPLPSRQTSRRGLTLRGCLIGVVLVIALIVAAVFVVPAVFLLLQEEQAQPSINEPRIR